MWSSECPCVEQCVSPCGAGCVIHWTRQIKEVLNAQEALEQADTAGPLEEIEFWTVRCEDLSGLTTQLDRPGVAKVCHILDRAKSSYLKQFRKLAKQICVRMCAVCEVVCLSVVSCSASCQHMLNQCHLGPHLTQHRI